MPHYAEAGNAKKYTIHRDEEGKLKFWTAISITTTGPDGQPSVQGGRFIGYFSPEQAADVRKKILTTNIRVRTEGRNITREEISMLAGFAKPLPYNAPGGKIVFVDSEKRLGESDLIARVG